MTAAGMVATPLAARRGPVRRALSSVVIGGLAVTTGLGAAQRWGPRRAFVALATIAPATAVVEKVGTTTGRPFGAYRYTSVLRPQIADVPAIVPLAWFAMSLPARETAHAALGRRSSVGGRILLGSFALAAWDLFLDPQMVGEGYWQWARRGRYRGIPLSNFVGWFLTGLAVMALLELANPPIGGADGSLVGEYAFVAVMETVGFAAFFADRTTAIAGAAGMLPVAGLAVGQLLRSDGRG
ncbi:MAG: carotenoid biosynthesis protein [Acidimicrobiia bacterium]